MTLDALLGKAFEKPTCRVLEEPKKRPDGTWDGGISVHWWEHDSAVCLCGERKK